MAWHLHSSKCRNGGLKTNVLGIMTFCRYGAILAIVMIIIDIVSGQAEESLPGIGWCPKAKAHGQRIVGGHDARRNEFPWLVSVRRSQHHICGGSILNSRYVLTAAHCVFDQRGQRYPADKFQLIAGAHEKDWHVEEVSRQVRQVDQIELPDKYTEIQTDVDLALMRTDRPFEFNTKVFPICITKERPESNTRCTVAGWGATKGTASGEILQMVQLPIIAEETCKKPDWYSYQMKPFEMCAGFAEGGQDSCQGDSGGPLMCKTHKHWVQAGAVSWGVDCAQAKKPGVYTDLSHSRARSWILEFTKLDTNPPKPVLEEPSQEPEESGDDDEDEDGEDGEGYHEARSSSQKLHSNNYIILIALTYFLGQYHIIRFKYA